MGEIFVLPSIIIGYIYKKNRMNFSTTKILFFSFLILFSCNRSENIETNINASDFSFVMDENPTAQKVIGKIEATTNQGSLTYEIISQNVTGAMGINTTSGEIFVATAAAFDFETNPIISGVAKISNGTIFKEVPIKITLRDVLETTISMNDHTFSITENPTNQQLIGKVTATTNVGNISYSIVSQSKDNALKIDAATGNLYVQTRSYFDFETNPVITATVKASNNEIFASSSIIVNLKDLNSCDEENANMENYFADFINTGNYKFSTTMDTKTHEYTFHVTESSDLCSVGYQTYTGKPCVIELVDENNMVLYSNTFTFSKTEQEYKSLPGINLEPNKNYTIRRRFESYKDTSDLIGKLFYNKDYVSPVLPFTAGKVIITQSKYYDVYKPTGTTDSIPFITLGFSTP